MGEVMPDGHGKLTNEDLSQALGQAIVDLLEHATAYSGASRSRIVLEAAVAYRALRGGPQPGSLGDSK